MVNPSAGLPGQSGVDSVSRRVVVDVLHGDSPVHDGADALPDAPCGLRLGGPDGEERLNHVPAGDLVHPQAAKRGEGVGLKTC